MANHSAEGTVCKRRFACLQTPPHFKRSAARENTKETR